MDGRLAAQDAQRIVTLYEGRLAEFGPDVRTVGWGSVEDQRLRFDMLCRDVALRGLRVLDIGCGLGDLVPYLHERTGGDFDYLGIDLSPALVREATKLHGGPHARFLAADILRADDVPAADLVVMSGALTYRVSDNLAHATAMLERMWDLTTNTLAINALSSYVDFQDVKNFHYEPEWFYARARQHTRWVSLISDYPLWEFTVQMRREPLSRADATSRG
jgi:SAM-dependent methyltransferase